MNGSNRFFRTSHQGSRCVLYQDSSIRWGDVYKAKYRFMPLESPFERVIDAILSESGDFLCVYNDVEIRIIEIPWAYSDVSSMTTAFQKYRYFRKKDESEIKQVLFHPLASLDSTIVVLRADDSICLQNWQDSKDVILLNEHNRALGIDGVATDVSSMSFSRDGLTLYVLSLGEGGDVYAFYPCLPSKLKIGKKEVDFLMSKSLIQYDSLDVETAAETKTNTIKQLHFVAAIRKKAINFSCNERFVTEISEERRQIRGQGPFTIAPFPEKLYDYTFQEIAVLPVGEDVELVLVTLDNGTVAILFNDLELTMNWDSINYNHHNSFVLLETIKIEEPGKIMTCDGQLGQFAIFSNTKTYFIDTKKWSEKMVNGIKNSDLRLVIEMDIESDITVIDSLPHANTVSFWKSFEEKSLVFVSNTSVVAKACTQDMLKAKRTGQLEDQSRSPYAPHFTQPMDEIMALNQSFQREASKPPSNLLDPRVRQEPLENASNEVQLDALTQISKDTMSKIARGQSLGLILHNRLIEQQFELTRQLKSAGDIIERQKVIKEVYQRELSSRDKIQSRQKMLTERLSNLQTKLAKVEDLPKFKDMKITRKEMEWFKEIRSQVINFNQYVHNQRNLQEQLRFVAKELKRKNSDTEQAKFLGDWEQLREMLEEDTKILNDCNAQLKHASTEFQIHTTT